MVSATGGERAMDARRRGSFTRMLGANTQAEVGFCSCCAAEALDGHLLMAALTLLNSPQRVYAVR